MTQTATKEVRIGNGNQKVGPITTFSLPSETSCPGASEWCSKNCYAIRMEKRWFNCCDAYALNFLASLDPESFVESMVSRIPPDLPALRIHVGGDFYSAFYVEAWQRICEQRPFTQFWAYTRSWVIPEIRESLDELKKLPNVALFASTDPSMPLPPEGWRIAFVGDDPRANGAKRCPTQQGKVGSCWQCKYCFRESEGDVAFKIH